FASRRGLFAAAGGLLAAAAVPGAARATAEPAIEPFWGNHQGGIITPPQRHSYFAAPDLTTRKAGDVAALMRAWTDAAARRTAGETARPLGNDPSRPPPDSGDALGLPPSRLTITFGFGPGLFSKDRYGLTSRRPQALVDMPQFIGDQLVEAHTGGDLSIQA